MGSQLVNCGTRIEGYPHTQREPASLGKCITQGSGQKSPSGPGALPPAHPPRRPPGRNSSRLFPGNARLECHQLFPVLGGSSPPPMETHVPAPSPIAVPRAPNSSKKRLGGGLWFARPPTQLLLRGGPGTWHLSVPSP